MQEREEYSIVKIFVNSLLTSSYMYLCVCVYVRSLFACLDRRVFNYMCVCVCICKSVCICQSVCLVTA